MDSGDRIPRPARLHLGVLTTGPKFSVASGFSASIRHTAHPSAWPGVFVPVFFGAGTGRTGERFPAFKDS
ncbi:MAG: hypothetical protein CMJ89_18550 [Planctomycetes bacterium]|jgi:hypothetical protein|nr:hypothetical protein [Planctomycetota bacterium]